MRQEIDEKPIREENEPKDDENGELFDKADTLCLEPSENPAELQDIDEDPSPKLFEEAFVEKEEDPTRENDNKSTEVPDKALENHEELKEALETKTPHDNQTPVPVQSLPRSFFLERLPAPTF